jgi:hypothetical protein
VVVRAEALAAQELVLAVLVPAARALVQVVAPVALERAPGARTLIALQRATQR